MDEQERQLNLQLIIGLLLELGPTSEERREIIAACNATFSGRDGERELALRTARALAQPILWSDFDFADRKDLTNGKDVPPRLTLQASGFSLLRVVNGWEAEELPMAEPFAHLVYGKFRRPFTYYDLWANATERAETEQHICDLLRYEKAFYRKCGQALFPVTIEAIEDGRSWFFFRRTRHVRRQHERLKLGQSVQRFAEQKIAEYYGWYAPEEGELAG